MSSIGVGDFIYLNPDLNQCKYRRYHGRRMEVLSVYSDGTLSLLGIAILPLISDVVLQEAFLKAVALKTLIQDPALPIEQVVEVFDALAGEECSPHPVKFWTVYKDVSQQLVAIHLGDQLALLKSLVSEDGRLF